MTREAKGKPASAMQIIAGALLLGAVVLLASVAVIVFWRWFFS
jgi:hypothetical protein